MFRVIFHLDMDAFYAAIEQRDDPSLRGKPVIVGSPPNQRGVVCAASYEARKFGVRSAMPSVTAGRLCPKGVFVRPRMAHYGEESGKIMAIVGRTGALIEQVSIDEAYLELSAIAAQSQPPQLPPDHKPLSDPSIITGEAEAQKADEVLFRAVPLARELKRRIFAERRLTASIGIAANKLLAKLASDFDKPDGLTLIPERDKVLFLRPMSVRLIHGVGKVTEQALSLAGIRTVGDLQDYPGDLRALVGSFGPRLKQFAFGHDDRPLELGEDVKSISSEETFLIDTDDRPALRRCLREQAAEISGKLKRRRLAAKTVQVKIRFSDFTTLTRQITVEEPVTEAGEIYRLGCFLLAKEKLVSRPLRLIGLGVSGLGAVARRQLVLL